MDRVIVKRMRGRGWLIRYPRALPLAIFLLVTAIAALSSFAIERAERQSQVTALHERAQAIASALERRANANASYLRAGAALFSAVEDVSASRFRRFVSELRLDADFRGAEGIGWTQRVDREGVDEFNRQIAAEYGPGMQLRPDISDDRPFAMAVAYLEPDSEFTRQALGFDMYADPMRREAMIEAEKTARPTSSGKVFLFGQGAARIPGFLIFMPVFERSSAGPRLSGYVFSVFNAQDFLESALQIEDAGGLGIWVYDREANANRLLASIEPEELQGPTVHEEVMVTDHPWVLKIKGKQPALLSSLALAILLLGLAVAALLATLARMLTRQATEDGVRLAWFEDQNAIRDSLTRELNHRVKNTLANVLSIVALTKRRANNIDEFAEGLDGRIRALSATHDLLTQSEWGRTPIRAVIEVELAPYAREEGPHISMEGPDIDLAPKDALSLGLAIHELATNAAKYGALSQAEGRLRVSWSQEGDDRARIAWTEEGGPPVPEQRERGFGLDLIEKIVAHELESPVELVFDPAGVRCNLIVPVRAPSKFELRSRPA